LPGDTNIDRITYNGNLAASVSGVNYLQGPSDLQRENIFLTNVNLMDIKNAYSHEFALGYQLQLTDERLFFVDVVHIEGKT
jgi:hypothetical protein